MSALVSFERVFEILDLDPADPGKARCTYAVPDGPVTVEFDNVRFAYPSADKVSLASLEEVATLDTRGGVEVLHGLSFRAEPGQMIALVGTSGAGKSTMAQIVPRLYDVDQGSVRICRRRHPGPQYGFHPRDRSAWSPRTGTCSTSRCGRTCCWPRPDATEDELWEVLDRARLRDLVESLPDGLDTVVGERGYRLSGGERQRLTIARLLLAQPRVVILDEATAHLDSTSEAAVQAALAEALAGRTAIVIAHRLSTIRAADQILVVEDGRIVAARHARRPARAGWTVRGAVPDAVRPAEDGEPERLARGRPERVG